MSSLFVLPLIAVLSGKNFNFWLLCNRVTRKLIARTLPVYLCLYHPKPGSVVTMFARRSARAGWVKFTSLWIPNWGELLP